MSAPETTLQRVERPETTLRARVKAAASAFRGGFNLPFNQANWFGGGYSAYTGYWGVNTAGSGGYFQGSDVDWKREAGPLTQNSIVMAIINWLCGAFPEAPLQVYKQTSGGRVDIPNHPLTMLIDEPNPFYDGTVLWMATLMSYNIDGNAYWIKWRNKAGEVVQLWYEPHFTIRPVWSKDDPTTFITGYEVNRANKWIPVDIENVVHFRWITDPDNPRKGLSPLASAYREIFTDKEGAAFSAITLKNLGWPSFILSPGNVEDDISVPDATRIKDEFEVNHTGDNRGRVMISPRAIKLDTWAWSPEQLNVKALRQLPAERVSALLRVPAEVTGLILDHKTYNNVAEAREQAYESNLVPCWRIFGKTITRAFRDEYPDWKLGMVADFELSQVRVLQDDFNRKATTMAMLFQRNIVYQDEARVAVNFDELPNDEGKRFYYEIVATGQGGGGKPTLGNPNAGTNDPLAADPPAAPAAPTDKRPPGDSPPNPPTPKKVLEAFMTTKRAYPAYTLDEGERELSKNGASEHG